MKLNKKALNALTNYYKHRKFNCFFSQKDRESLAQLFVGCIWNDDGTVMTVSDYAYKEIRRTILHVDIFFRSKTNEATYKDHLHDSGICKLLKTIVKNGKFPGTRSLTYPKKTT